MFFEPGPIAPLDPRLFEALGADRPMTEIVAEAIGSLEGTDDALNSAQIAIGDARFDALDAADDRELEGAGVQLAAELEADGDDAIAALAGGAAAFEGELGLLGADLPVEGARAEYEEPGTPTDAFTPRDPDDDGDEKPGAGETPAIEA